MQDQGRYLEIFLRTVAGLRVVGVGSTSQIVLYFFKIIVCIYLGCAGSSCRGAFPAAAMAEALLARCLGPWA